MYQVVIETKVDGKREIDSVLSNVYKVHGFAVRKAKEYNGSYDTSEHHIERKAYVRKVLKVVDKETAKENYCKNRNVYVDGEYGVVKIRESGNYGSHAPIEELFYRGFDYWYKGDFYIECD